MMSEDDAKKVLFTLLLARNRLKKADLPHEEVEEMIALMEKQLGVR